MRSAVVLDDDAAGVGCRRPSRPKNRASPNRVGPGLLAAIAFWAIMLGIGEIIGAFASRKGGSGSWGWTLAVGILNVVFGIVLLIWPASGILVLVWVVGIFTLAGGMALIVLAFRVRSLAKSAAAACPTA